MAEMWKNLCESLRESGLKNCEEKSGKMWRGKKLVEKVSYPRGCEKVLHVDLNTKITTVIMVVFHGFHRYYYYNY